MRLDQYIAAKFGYSRNRAQFFIDENMVKVNSIIVNKNSLKIEEDDVVEIAEEKKTNYVSRSALKLDAFFDEINIRLDWKTCLDVWASTWWFTQVLLERWAARVFAIDVWSSQLHDKVKIDERVVSMENCDIRELKKETLWTEIGLIVVDVSFIWLAKILDSLISLSDASTEMILLFKPQFEVGKINMKKTWVPKDAKVIKQALENFRIVCKEKNLRTTKISESKLPGEAGNIEYFIYLNCSFLFSEWIQKS